jgi:hypothetical protein
MAPPITPRQSETLAEDFITEKNQETTVIVFEVEIIPGREKRKRRRISK